MANVLKFPRRRRSEKATAAAQERKMARLLGEPIDPERIPQAMTLLTWAWMAGVAPCHTCVYPDGMVMIPEWILHQRLERLIASAPHPGIKIDLMRANCRPKSSQTLDPTSVLH